MGLKKQEFNNDEITIFDEALVYKRGDRWHFRTWLEGEGKYARLSLKTDNRATAIDRGKKTYLEILANKNAGKTYFSLSATAGVKLYVDSRQKDVDAGIIVKGRLVTIRAHLKHWLDFVGKTAKLKELERTACENYFHSRTQAHKNLSVSQTTVLNEQSTINAMMSWLYKRGEVNIQAFDFPKLPRIDRGDEQNRRSSFSSQEVTAIQSAVFEYIGGAIKDLSDKNNITKVLVGYYILIASITGMRTGEQRQLLWSDIQFDLLEKGNAVADGVKILIRAENSKVRKRRQFYVRDSRYFEGLFNIISKINAGKPIGNFYVFSPDGTNMISERAILFHFKKIMEVAQIENTDRRKLVPYSLRHSFITEQVNLGQKLYPLSYMCGTSPREIDKTYFHMNDQTMRNSAMLDFVPDEFV